MTLFIRPAVRSDVSLILDLIVELAHYERLASAVKIIPAQLDALLFSPDPAAFCEIAEWRGAPAGFTLWFYTVSTFEGRRGIHLEDLFVRPAARGQGVGKALLARLARRCLREDLARLEWAVLEWNAPAIAFYDRLGAETASQWITRRLDGEPLRSLASGGLDADDGSREARAVVPARDQ